MGVLFRLTVIRVQILDAIRAAVKKWAGVGQALGGQRAPRVPIKVCWGGRGKGDAMKRIMAAALLLAISGWPYQLMAHAQSSARDIETIDWSPDGSFLAVGDDDGLVYIYDSTTGAQIMVIPPELPIPAATPTPTP